ncbi:hypothetical protein LDENG_00012460 [Lucifuga dentata]|nr:hypothetical protein LDENG_00012460 [Lucifuga dentata]
MKTGDAENASMRAASASPAAKNNKSFLFLYGAYASLQRRRDNEGFRNTLQILESQNAEPFGGAKGVSAHSGRDQR